MDPLIIIPAYNSESTIISVLKPLPKNNVLVVDDGSQDKTAEIVSSNGFNIISLQSNKGVGYALKVGFEYGLKNNYSHVITIDSDGQHESALWSLFLNKLADYTYVIGNRFNFIHNVPHQKISSNFFGSNLLNYLFGIKLLDVTCGFRGFLLNSKVLSITATSYDFLHQHLLTTINDGTQIGTVNIPAVYDFKEFLGTRYAEIIGFLESVYDFSSNEIKLEIFRLINCVREKQDFYTTINGYSFSAYFVQSKNSYVFQTNIEDVRRFYE